jgi:hypothetical protein
MAVRKFDSDKNLVADVHMHDGRFWVGCDLCPQKSDRVFAFWVDKETVLMVPVADIKVVTYYEQENKQ